MVHILVSFFSLHSGFLLVIRDEMPVPQLLEHCDQLVVSTGQLFDLILFNITFVSGRE